MLKRCLVVSHGGRRIDPRPYEGFKRQCDLVCVDVNVVCVVLKCGRSNALRD